MSLAKSLIVGLGTVVGVSAMASEFNQRVDDFDKVQFQVNGSIELIKSDENRVSLEVVKGDPDLLKVTVNGNTLSISNERRDSFRFWRPRKGISVVGKVYYESVNQLVVSGSGTITTTDLSEPSMALFVRGAGDIEIESISSEDVESSIRGSGDIRIERGTFGQISSTIQGSGNIEIGEATTERNKVKVQGSGDYDGRGLVAKDASVVIQGSGDVQLHASGTLDVSIRGSGDLDYWGQPKVSTSIQGSGAVSGH